MKPAVLSAEKVRSEPVGVHSTVLVKRGGLSYPGAVALCFRVAVDRDTSSNALFMIIREYNKCKITRARTLS